MQKAFTLIELLVVVLIIGILSAVALPQYQVAVEKSRVSTLLPMLKTIHDAEKVYLLTNNTYSANIDELGIDIPGKNIESQGTSSAYYSAPNGLIFYLDKTSKYVSGGTHLIQIDLYENGNMYCFAKADSSVAERICKSLGVSNFGSGFCGLIVVGESVACKGGAFSF